MSRNCGNCWILKRDITTDVKDNTATSQLRNCPVECPNRILITSKSFLNRNTWQAVFFSWHQTCWDGRLCACKMLFRLQAWRQCRRSCDPLAGLQWLCVMLPVAATTRRPKLWRELPCRRRLSLCAWDQLTCCFVASRRSLYCVWRPARTYGRMPQFHRLSSLTVRHRMCSARKHVSVSCHIISYAPCPSW